MHAIRASFTPCASSLSAAFSRRAVSAVNSAAGSAGWAPGVCAAAAAGMPNAATARTIRFLNMSSPCPACRRGGLFDHRTTDVDTARAGTGDGTPLAVVGRVGVFEEVAAAESVVEAGEDRHGLPADRPHPR